MPVGIVEVTNATTGIIHYTNQESGYTFSLNPTPKAYAKNRHLSTSQYKDDTVPFKSSGKKIIVTIDHGPQFTICDDNWTLSVVEKGAGTAKPEQWTVNISNGEQFVMVVHSKGVIFVPYNSGLRASGDGGISADLLMAGAEAVGAAAELGAAILEILV